MRSLKVLIALAVTAPIVGCAARGDVKTLKTELASLRMEAQEARRIADEAKRSADEADARAQRTEQIVNRSFKKSMYK